MIDFRIYRAGLVGIAFALVVAMFSLESRPQPVRTTTAPDAFDGARTAALARDLATDAPEPRPGSASDRALEEVVTERFAEVEGGQLSVQEFEGSFEGDDVDLRNVILVLPGTSDRQVALIAQRDAARGTGAQSAAAATASLIELAASFGGATHSKTLVFVSTAGADIGAIGAKRFADDYSGVHMLDAAIVLSQPGAATPQKPLVVPWADDPDSTSIELRRSAEAAITDEVGISAGDEGAVGSLLRLALPVAIGEQAPLIEQGIDAVRISSSGERPPAPEHDVAEDISAESLDRFGRATLALLLALDEKEDSLEHGPDAYIQVAGNLVPGWALALISLALLLPVAAAAAHGFLRAAIARPRQAFMGVGWVTGRSLPFLGGLILAWLLSLVSLVARPEFPYDPGRFELGVGGAIAMGLVLAATGAGIYAIGPLRPPPRIAAESAISSALVVASVTALGVWAVNPYLALLVAPALHLWMLAALAGPGRRFGLATLLVAAGMVPLLIVMVELAGRLGVGLAIPWHLLILLSGGEFGAGVAVLACLLGGCALAVLALAAAREPLPSPPPEIRVQGPEEERSAKLVESPGGALVPGGVEEGNPGPLDHPADGG